MKIRRARPVMLVALAAATVAVAALPAAAHVSVKPSSAPKGGFEVLSFNVPNEEPDANTVKLEVELPTRHPVAYVSTQPMFGWTVSVEKSTWPSR
jgi:uncharacterized protein